MSRASALYRLQEIDTQIDQRQARLTAIEQQLSDDHTARALHEQAVAVEAQLKSARVSQRSLELDINELNDKIAELDQRLYGGSVSNTKELKDLQMDVEGMRRRRAGVEEQQFEALMQIERAEIQLAQVLDQLTHAEDDDAKRNAHLIEESAHLKAEIEHLQNDHEIASISVPAADRELYAHLRQTKKSPAVALFADEVCTVCGVEPTSADQQSVRQGSTLIQCANCERILYAE